ncbi:hypothetical protein CR513_58413, partial [Mucuna pruriens]
MGSNLLVDLASDPHFPLSWTRSLTVVWDPKYVQLSKGDQNLHTSHCGTPRFGQISKGRQKSHTSQEHGTLKSNQVSKRRQESHASQEYLRNQGGNVPQFEIDVPRPDMGFKVHDLEMHDFSKRKNKKDSRARVNPRGQI